MAIDLLSRPRTLAMPTRTLCPFCRARSARTHAPRRLQSSTGAGQYDHLTRELPARRRVVIYDDLTPRNSHWLSVTLSSFLPPSWTAASTRQSPLALPSAADGRPLPPAHHLVYFNPAYPASDLLPDGTDPNQSPGPPFARRMWAGGRVRWHPRADGVAADGRRWACVEGIRDVAVKGTPGAERVFVGIERRFGPLRRAEPEDAVRERLWEEREERFGDAPLVERRNIVFMRERTAAELEELRKLGGAPAVGKMLKPQHPPTFTHSLTPTPSLLFRYSALTFNAHAIHLDPLYCRAIEAHRAPLLHGPLAFTLLTTMLHHRVQADGKRITALEYRNLAPLYVGEPVKLCGREVQGARGDEGRFEVWAETPEGGVAVRGTAWVE